MAVPVESRFVTVRDGLRLHARDYGDRTAPLLPVVCLPGLSRTAEDFERLAVRLAADGRRVLALDYRGRGLSAWDPDPENYDLQVESNDIADVLTALGISRALFVGTSRGGLHIMLLSALRPGFLAGAVLNDIGPVIEPAGLARIKGYIGKAPPLRDWDDALATMQGIADGRFTGLDDAEWRAYARLTFQEKDGRIQGRYDPGLLVNLAAMDLAKVPELWPQYDGLAHLPLLVVRGANSDLLSPGTAAAMLARHPGAELVTVPGQGHAPLLRDDPTIERIATFVARCGEAPRDDRGIAIELASEPGGPNLVPEGSSIGDNTMRTRLVGLLLGLGCLLGTAAPSLACAFHDQQASAATQQQTADAQSGTTRAQ